MDLQRRNLAQASITVTKKLGTGKFDVFHAKAAQTRQEFALKLFPNNQASQAVYQRESQIIVELNHENVIKCLSTKNIVHEGADYNSILTEYAPHGTFFEFLTYKGLNKEKLMRTYFHQLVNGIEYMHSKGIAHLDLKLENLLIGKDFRLKIADFDQSQKLDEDKLLFSGTSCYRAPEVWTNNCRNFKAADIYSMGIILFAFKTNSFPFIEIDEGANKTLLRYDQFNEENQSFWLDLVADLRNKNCFDEAFKELVNGMLASDPSKRWTLQQVKKSAWFNGATFSNEEFQVEMEKVWEQIHFIKYMKKSM